MRATTTALAVSLKLNFRSFIFNSYILQNRLEKMYVHAFHTVPEMRVAAGRFRDGMSLRYALIVLKETATSSLVECNHERILALRRLI